MEENNKIKAMIITLGGTIEPLIKSILHYQPEFICYFASQQTYELSFNIRTEVEKNNAKYQSEMVLVDNPNDLLHCYEKAEDAVKKIFNKGYNKNEVIVDYTGGTKNMSVAISLASILQGFSFSYVGGSERTKDGKGIVISGHEKVYSSINPWDFLAKDDFLKFCLFFDSYQFSSAGIVLSNILNKTTKFRVIYEMLSQLVDAYKFWDLFRHKEAYRTLKKIDLRILAEFEFYNFKKLSEQISKNLKFLENLEEKKSLKVWHIYDLIANADRRFEEGKIDDAILRLYRVTEMLAQLYLKEGFNIDTSKVDTNQIPKEIRDEYVKKYLDPETKKLKIPLFASYNLLKYLNHEIGNKFIEQQDAFKKILNARNSSYLAHGFDSSKEETYIKFKETILELSGIRNDEIPEFPKFSDCLK